MKAGRGAPGAGALVALWVLAGSVLAGQSNDEANGAIQFDLSTPGARSLGLGGSFVAVADDATAAYSNPAGLTQLLVGGMEVSAEYRRWTFKTDFPTRGHVAGEPAGIGVDTVAGIERDTSETSTNGLSFVSVATPVAKRWVVALYRHQLAKFEADFRTDGLFVGESSRVFPAHSQVDLRIHHVGLSAGVEVNDRLSLGAGVSRYELDYRQATRRYEPAPPTGDATVDRLPGGFYGVPDFLGDNLWAIQSQRGDDSDLGFAVGALYELDDEGRWRLGANYRSGPDFDYDAAFVWGPKAGVRGRAVPGSQEEGLGGPSVFRVPDFWSLGASYRPRLWNVVAAFEVKRVRYSRLTEDVLDLLTVSNRNDRFLLEDGTEWHLGVEHLLIAPSSQGLGSQLAVTVRCGVWLDPDHRLRYEGNSERLAARFGAGEDEWHYTAGIGVIRGENFQVDASFDISARINTISLSIVKFF